MKKTTSLLAVVGLAAVVLAGSTSPDVRAATVEISDDAAGSAVTVGGVARRGDTVVGTLTNRGGDQIHDIRLSIDIPFLWANEFKPGEDSPGRSSVLTVKGPLAPHGQLAFEFTPNPPLPERTDGRFGEPKVQVMGFSAVGTQQ